MNYYIDIEIQPDNEMRENVLLNKVYTKFHKALCELKATDIGVSFPKHKILLGRVLRIHSSSNSLEKLQAKNWLGGLAGYCKVSAIKPVPEQIQHRIVSRKQTTMSQSKLNRLIKRQTIPEENVKIYKANMFAKGLDNAYLELTSASNGHTYRRYIQFSEMLPKAVEGTFDAFGLSRKASIPWFD
ncbi:type I-F CRISPR-associated endoribonuclease Cas6/Csy4 [Marinomonas agarivorans]|nr:type I-F CRISPR-associated endoribonuclease Cas6/Csy4 [Marinomonas agarivorans]